VGGDVLVDSEMLMAVVAGGGGGWIFFPCEFLFLGCVVPV